VSAPRPLARALEVLGPFLGLAAVVLFFGLQEPSFLTQRNFQTIAVQSVVVSLGAIGMTFVIAGGGIDLSIGSVVALASVAAAWALDGHVPGGTGPALALGVLCGGACGLAIGALVTALGIVPFIVTLGMMGAARGAAKWLASEQTIHPAPEAVAGIGSLVENSFASPGVWLTVLLGLVAGGVLRATVFGTHVFALGSNEEAARLCGVPVRRTKVWVYTLSGLFAGLAGVMQLGRLSVGDPTTAVGLELEVIAAVVIGGGSLAGGSGSILGSIVGAVLMRTLGSGCNLTEVPNYVQEILIGVIIVVAVAIDRWRRGAARSEA